MELFIEYLAMSTVISSLLVSFGLWLSKEWFLTRLKDSIKHEYDKRLEEHKYEVEKRKKAEMVAKLLAHWISVPEQQEELNRLTFECFLWLPDDIAKDLSALLAHQRESKVTVRSVLSKIRTHLHSEHKTPSHSKLEEYEIIIFTKESRRKIEKRINDSLG